ncbi:MAG: outer membrane protein assembly factor BamE [Alphaproteobacteria bacterium]|nr:outer membrane protein assembly factor BamE [Alphaproteobacteria bacterium]
MSINKIILSGLVALFLTTGCSKEWFTTYNGNMPTPERVSKLEKGLSKNEVIDLLGAPSNIVSLDKNTWLYMSSEVEQIAFMRPTELQRQLLVLRFDQHEQVAQIQRLSLKDGEDIKISEAYTPDVGKDLGFFEKYFGGVNQYNPMGGGGSNAPM